MTKPEPDLRDKNEEMNIGALIGDLQKLEEHIKDFSVRWSIINVIESALQKNFFEEYLVVERLSEIVGEEAANAIFWVLRFNDLVFVRQLNKKGLSPEVSGFLLELVARLGKRLEERIEAEHSPNRLANVKSMSYYMPETHDTWVAFRLRRTDGQTFVFDGTINEIFEIIHRCFKSMLEAAKETRNKIPDAGFGIDLEELEQYHEDLNTFKEIVIKSQSETTE